MISISTDEGESWTAATDSNLPNPGASVEALVLDDGRWLMIMNDSDQNRANLSIVISEDEGKNWTKKRVLESARMAAGKFSYPSIIQGNDGQIHLTYSYHVRSGKSIKYISINSQDLP